MYRDERSDGRRWVSKECPEKAAEDKDGVEVGGDDRNRGSEWGNDKESKGGTVAANEMKHSGRHDE